MSEEGKPKPSQIKGPPEGNMAPGWCHGGLKDPPTSPPRPKLQFPSLPQGALQAPGRLGRSAARGPELPSRSGARGALCGARVAAPLPATGGAARRRWLVVAVWGGGGAAAAGGAEGGLAGGSGARRRRWWEAAGGSAGLAGPGDGGRGGLPGGQAAAASVRGHRGLVLGLGPRGGGGGRRSGACAAHSGLAGRHGAGHERGGAPGLSGEWRPRRALEAGVARPAGGLPGGLCEGAVGWG